MEEIEYLEEFEDMVQTSIATNTMRSSANNKETEREMGASVTRQDAPGISDGDVDDDRTVDDGDESSCPYDIFEKLFKDSNEDRKIDKKRSTAKKKPSAASSSTSKPNVRHGPDSFSSSDYDSDDPFYKMIHGTDDPKLMSSRTGADGESLDSLDALVDDLGEYLPESSQKSQSQKPRTVQNSRAVTTSKQNSDTNSLNSIRGRPPISNKTTGTAPVKKSSTHSMSKSKEILSTKNPLVSMKPQMAVRKVLDNSEPKLSQRPTSNKTTTQISKVVTTTSAASTTISKSNSTSRLSKPKPRRHHTMNKTKSAAGAASPSSSSSSSRSSRLNGDKPSTSTSRRSYVNSKELKAENLLQPNNDPLNIEYFDDDDDDYQDEDNDDVDDSVDTDDPGDVDEDDFMSISGNESYHSSDYDLFDSNIDSGENIIDISTDSNNSKFSELRSTPPPNISDNEIYDNDDNNDVDDDGVKIDYFKELREKYFDNIREYFDPNQNQTKKQNIHSSITTTTTTTMMDNSLDKSIDDDRDDKDLSVSFDKNNTELTILTKDSSFERNRNEKNTNANTKKVIDSDSDSDKLTKVKAPVNNDKETGELVEASEQQNNSLEEITEIELSKSNVGENNKDEERDEHNDSELTTTDLNDLDLSTTSSEIKDFETMPLFNITDSESKSDIDEDLDSFKDLTISAASTTTKIDDIDLMTKINNLSLDQSESMLEIKDLESSEESVTNVIKEYSSVVSPTEIVKIVPESSAEIVEKLPESSSEIVEIVPESSSEMVEIIPESSSEIVPESSSDKDSKSKINDLETITKVKDNDDSSNLETQSNKEEVEDTSSSLTKTDEFNSVRMSEPKAESTPCIQLPISSLEVMEPTSTTTENDSSKDHRVKRRLYTHESDCDGGGGDGNGDSDNDKKDTDDADTKFNESIALEQIEQSSLELQKQIIEMDNNLDLSLEYQHHRGSQSENLRRSSVSNKITQKNTPQKILHKNYPKEKSTPSASTSTSSAAAAAASVADSTKKDRDKSSPRKTPMRRRGGEGGGNPISNSKEPSAAKIESCKNNPINKSKEIIKDQGDKKSEKDKEHIDKSIPASATDEKKKKTTKEFKKNVKESHDVDNNNPEKNSEVVRSSSKNKKRKNKSEISRTSEKDDSNIKSSKSIEAINASSPNSEKQKSPVKIKEIKQQQSESQKQKPEEEEGDVCKNNESNSGSMTSNSDINEKTQVQNKNQMDNEKISKSSIKSKEHKFEKPQERKSVSESARKIRSCENSSDSNRSRNSSLDEKKLQNVMKSSLPSRRDYKSSESDSSTMSSSSDKKSLERKSKDDSSANVSIKKSKSSHSLRETVKKSEGDHSKKPKENIHKDVGGVPLTKDKDKEEYHTPVKDNIPSTSKDIKLSKETNNDKIRQKSFTKDTDKRVGSNVAVVATPQKSISKDLDKRGGVGNVKEEKINKTPQKSIGKNLDKRGGGNSKEDTPTITKPKEKEVVKLKEKKDMKTGNANNEQPSTSSSLTHPSGDDKKNLAKRKSLTEKSKSNAEIVTSEHIKQPLIEKKLCKSLSSSSLPPLPLAASSISKATKASLEQSDYASIKKLNTAADNDNANHKPKEQPSSSSSSSSVSQSEVAKKSATTTLEKVTVCKESTDKALLHDEATVSTNELSVQPRRSKRRNEEIVVSRNIPTPNIIRETRSTIKQGEEQSNPSTRSTRNRDTNIMMKTQSTRSVAKNVLETKSNTPEKVGETDDSTDSSGGEVRKRKQISASELEPKIKMNRSAKKEMRIDSKKDTEKTVEDHKKESLLEEVASEKAIVEPVSLKENVDDEITTIESKVLDEVTPTSTITKTPTENEPSKFDKPEEIVDDKKTKNASENQTQNVLDEVTNDTNSKAAEKEQEHASTSSSSLLHLEKSKKKLANEKQLELDIKTSNFDELIKTTTVSEGVIQQEVDEVMPPGTSDETTYDNLPASSDLLPLCENAPVLPCDDVIVDQVIEVAFSQIDSNCVVGSGGNPINDVVNSLVIGGEQNDEISKEMAILFNTEINCDNEKLLQGSASESSRIIKDPKALMSGSSKNLNDSDPTKAIIEIAKILQEESESMEAIEFRRNDAPNIVGLSSIAAPVDETFKETDGFLLKSSEGTLGDTLSDQIAAKQPQEVQSSTDSTNVIQDTLNDKNTIKDLLVGLTSDADCPLKTEAATEKSKGEILNDAPVATNKGEEGEEPSTSKSEKNQKDLKLQEEVVDTIVNNTTKEDINTIIATEKKDLQENNPIDNLKIVDKEIIVEDSTKQKIELDHTKIVSKTRNKKKMKSGSSKPEILNNVEIATKSDAAPNKIESDKKIASSSSTSTESNGGNNRKVDKMDTNIKTNHRESKPSDPQPSNPQRSDSMIMVASEFSKTKLRVRVKRVIADDIIGNNSAGKRGKSESGVAEVKVTSEKATTSTTTTTSATSTTSSTTTTKSNFNDKQTQETTSIKSKDVDNLQPTKVQDGYLSTDTDTSSTMKVTRSLRNRGVETPVNIPNDPLKRRFNRLSGSSKHTPPPPPTTGKQTRFSGNRSGNVDDTPPPSKKLKLTGNSEGGNQTTKNNKPEKPSNSHTTGSLVLKEGSSTRKEANKTTTTTITTSTVTRRSTPQLYKEMNERMATRHKPITTPPPPAASSNTNTKSNVDIGEKISKKKDIEVTAKSENLVKAPPADEIKEPVAKKQRESLPKTPTTIKKAETDILELDKSSKKNKSTDSKFDKLLSTAMTKTHHDILAKETLLKPTTSTASLATTITKETTPKAIGHVTRRQVVKTPGSNSGIGDNGAQNNTPAKHDSSINTSNLSIQSKPLVLTTLQRKSVKDIIKSSQSSASSSRDTSKDRSDTKKPVSVSKSIEIAAKPPTKPTVETTDTKQIDTRNKTEKVKGEGEKKMSQLTENAKPTLTLSLSSARPSTSKDVKNPTNILRNSKGRKVQEEKSSTVQKLAATGEQKLSKPSVETVKVVAVTAPKNTAENAVSAEISKVSIKDLGIDSKATSSHRRSSKTTHSSQTGDGGKPVKETADAAKAMLPLENSENSTKDHGGSGKAVHATKISNKPNNPPQSQPLKDQKASDKSSVTVPSTAMSKSAETPEILNKVRTSFTKVLPSASRTLIKTNNQQQQTSDNKETKPSASVDKSSKPKPTTTTTTTKETDIVVASTSSKNVIETSAAVNSKNTRKSLRERVPPVKLRNAGQVNNNSNSNTMEEVSSTQPPPPPLTNIVNAESLHTLACATRSTSSLSISSEMSTLSNRFRKRKNVVTPAVPITSKRVRLDPKQLATKSNTSSVDSSEAGTAEKSTTTTRQLPKQQNLPSTSKPPIPVSLTVAPKKTIPLNKDWLPVVRLSRSVIQKFTENQDVIIKPDDAGSKIVNLELKEELDDTAKDADIETLSNTQLTKPQVGPTTSAISVPPTTTSIVTRTTATSTGDGTTSTSIVNNPNVAIGSTRTYSYIHPAKYRSSYGQVQLDYCCPDLAGPMTAIDPTRLHQKIEAPVLEVPRYIVLTTKVIKASDYKKNPQLLPEQVRLKLERRNGEVTFIANPSAQETKKQTRAIAEKMSTDQQQQTLMKANQSHMPNAAATTSALAVKTATTPQVAGGKKQLPTVSSKTPIAITSTTKQNVRITPQRVQKPATIDAAAVNAASSSTAAATSTSGNSAVLQSIASSMIELNIPQTSNALSGQERSELRRNAEMFSELLVKLSKIMLPMTEQHRRNIIDNIVNNSLLHPIDFEHGIKMLQNYEMWIKMAASSSPLPTTSKATASRATRTTTSQAAEAVSAGMTAETSKTLNEVTGLFENETMPTIKTPLTKPSVRPRASAGAIKQDSPQVAASTKALPGFAMPIYDVDRNIVGYQMPISRTDSNQTRTVHMPTTSKATVPTIMKTNNRGGKLVAQAANTTTKGKQASLAAQVRTKSSPGFGRDNKSSPLATNTTTKVTGTIRVRGQQLLANKSNSCSTPQLSVSTSPAVGKVAIAQSNKKAVPNKEKPAQLIKQPIVTTVSPITPATDGSSRKTPAPRSNRRSVKHPLTSVTPTTSTDRSNTASSSYQQRPSTSSKPLNTSITAATTNLLTITALKAATQINIIEPEPMEESILPDLEDTTTDPTSIEIKSEEMDEEIII